MHRSNETIRMNLNKTLDNFEFLCKDINEQLNGIIYGLSNDNHEVLDINNLISKPLDQLQIWRDQTKNLIDEIYNQKKSEMIDLIKIQQRSNENFLSKDNQLKNIDIKELTSNCIKTLEPFGYDIHFKQHYRLASNGNLILFYQFGCLFLIDQHGSIIRQLFWREDCKFDACWSPILAKFLFIGHQGKSVWTMDKKDDNPIQFFGSKSHIINLVHFLFDKFF